jgi:hypothetical protein
LSLPEFTQRLGYCVARCEAKHSPHSQPNYGEAVIYAQLRVQPFIAESINYIFVPIV